MKNILEIDPSNDLAGKSIRRLETLAAVKREKMKEEMIGESFSLIVFQIFIMCFIDIFCMVVCGHSLIAFDISFIVKCLFFYTILFNVKRDDLNSFSCLHQTIQASDGCS
ncbi:unnamed protein product [Vicia faba]|uniref:Uncharacterized protein n=1 Tax=Vicia faba TaxID=3906 RepID=A0AAV0Z918_VICFA|nr:unnamed protein product [Vicia faba]